ncbi:MAG TPA: response regulator transcription factor [Chloroflexota bacterium]|nr:response regulator transcription factor [Chloroflexota bacterium]
MRVLLADDHLLLLEGLCNLLEAHGIDVVGVAKNGWEAADRAKSLRPDLILMDIRMPGCDGLAATRLIKSEMPEAKIVILTTSTESDDLFEAVKSGAMGYLLKSMDGDALIEALRDAEEDVPPFAPGFAAKLLAEFARQAKSTVDPPPSPPTEATAVRTSATASGLGTWPPDEPLTARQIEVLTLVAQGLAYKQIAASISLSPRTVKYHMTEIMRKLHLQNRAQVLAYAGALARSRGSDRPR